MAFCTTCGAQFNGRGNHCTRHSSYLQDYYNQYTSDSHDVVPIKYRTGRFRSSSHNRHRKPRQIGYHDSYNALDTYNPQTNEWANNYNGYNGSDPITHPTTILPLTTTFDRLANNHSIAELTYSIEPTGKRSITATANPDREQCPVCFQYFADVGRLRAHTWEFPIGCERHRVCLRDEDAAWHAQSERHERCFVRGCTSVYRREGGWRGIVVENHVKGWHS
ncbi:hypothetical protein K458DRAFT_289830 [Lentithecium fluviatile CBS 122367]|uniref:Uncharacterized protein n=1 Tax=Lentithecium fluviatile CBS 122367 TaxID=1168545 RepID=A0A6G1JJU2_9PLEO|nr:hypothetical protein K458DRAFT_289830 [Lentithecium fluviatile CBS 122367]